MQVTSFLRQHAQALAGASLLLGLGAAANATDTYVGSTDTVTIPSVAVGNYTLSNVTAKVGGIVTLPSGTAPNGAYDTYDPATQQLTSQSVLVGSTTYYNPVVTLTSPVTIGGATGADTYANGQLTIQRLQLGTTVYTGVVVNVVPSDVVGIGGGLPASTADSYSGGVLTLPVLSAFGNIYTNVSLNVTPSEVSVIGSHFTGVLSTGFYTNGTTQTAGTTPGAYGTYQGSGGGAANGSGGGYLDSSPPANPSYEYIYISDTLTNIGGYSYQGVFVQPGSGQVVGTGGFNALNFSLGVNPASRRVRAAIRRTATRSSARWSLHCRRTRLRTTCRCLHSRMSVRTAVPRSRRRRSWPATSSRSTSRRMAAVRQSRRTA